MKDKETSIVLEFKDKNLIDLAKINLKEIKKIGDYNLFKKDEKIQAMAVNSHKKPHIFLITQNGITANNMTEQYSKTFKKEVEDLAKMVLNNCGLSEKDYIIKSTYIEFKSNYSLREKVFGDLFKQQIEELLTKKGYNVPDYASIILVLSKAGKQTGQMSIGYKNHEEYSKNLATIQAPEELKEDLSKLK